MGQGSDVATESAGVTVVRGDPEGVVRAHRLARLTIATVRQNLSFAFVCNMPGVPIAAGVLCPIAGQSLSPMPAGAAKSLSSVAVIASSLRLRRVGLRGCKVAGRARRW